MIMTDQDHDGSHIKERDRGGCENKNSFARHGNFTTEKKDKNDIQQMFSMWDWKRARTESLDVLATIVFEFFC